MLEMTKGIKKWLRSDYCLHITISIMPTLIAWFTVVYRLIRHKSAMYYYFQLKYCIISAL